MKIAAILEQTLRSGGGYQQSINAALQAQRICQEHYDLCIYTNKKTNIKKLNNLGLKAKYFVSSLLDRLLPYAMSSTTFSFCQSRLKLIGPLEKRFIEDGIDLVYFLGPSWIPAAFQKLNYVFTVWDLCHRDFPEFPEVRNFGEFERREGMFNATLLKAYMIMADSEKLKQLLIRYYGVNSERVLVMPFQGMTECNSNATIDQRRDIISMHGLNPEYLFYPANLWSHKGHVRIIQALSLFRDRNGYVPDCVFSGGDSGNMEFVKSCAKRDCLDASIKFLGFIPDEHIPILYLNSLALIMPTYFGPTNLPPLEAMSLGVPVIYPIHLKNQCGDAALYFDADDPVTLCEAIEKVCDPTVRAEFSRKGLAQHKMIAQRLSDAETEFRSRLDVFQRRLICWSRS